MSDEEIDHLIEAAVMVMKGISGDGGRRDQWT